MDRCASRQRLELLTLGQKERVATSLRLATAIVVDAGAYRELFSSHATPPRRSHLGRTDCQRARLCQDVPRDDAFLLIRMIPGLLVLRPLLLFVHICIFIICQSVWRQYRREESMNVRRIGSMLDQR